MNFQRIVGTHNLDKTKINSIAAAPPLTLSTVHNRHFSSKCFFFFWGKDWVAFLPHFLILFQGLVKIYTQWKKQTRNNAVGILSIFTDTTYT